MNIKKILMVLSLFISVVHADLYDDGEKAYNNNNIKEAINLWKKAADQGNARAQDEMGFRYSIGMDVIKDRHKGYELSKEACNKGYERSCRIARTLQVIEHYND